MIVKNFSFSDKIILSIILLNIVDFAIIPGIALSVDKVYVIQILILLFVILINLNLNLTKKLSLRRIKIDLFFFLGISIIFLFILSSFYVNLDFNLKSLAIAKLLTYPVIIFPFFFYIPHLFFNENELFEKFLDLCLYFSFFSVIFALGILILGLDYNRQYTDIGIAAGFYYSANTFAFVFTFAIPIIIYKYFVKRISLIPFILFLVPTSICLLFTYSRAGYIGVFIALIIQMYKRSKTILIGGVLILALIGSTFVFSFAQSKGSSSTLSRAQVMYVGYNMIMNNGLSKFLWGYGILNNREVFVKELGSSFGSERPEMGPHNMILSLGIQFGMLLTLFTLAFILLLVFKASLIKKVSTQFEFAQKINLSIAIVIGILAQCFFEDLVIYPEFFVMPLFLIFLGILAYSVQGYKPYHT